MGRLDNFHRIKMDLRQAKKELDEYTEYLVVNNELEERKGVLDFFKQRIQLTLLLGRSLGIIGEVIFRYEYPLEGEFQTDLIFIEPKNNNVYLIEFENAKKDSLFTKKARATEYWSDRFEQGFSQLIDWLWVVNDLERTNRIGHMFNLAKIENVRGFLMIGRESHLEGSVENRNRFSYRKKYLKLDRAEVKVMDFEEVERNLVGIYSVITEGNATEFKETIL